MLPSKTRQGKVLGEMQSIFSSVTRTPQLSSSAWCGHCHAILRFPGVRVAPHRLRPDDRAITVDKELMCWTEGWFGVITQSNGRGRDRDAKWSLMLGPSRHPLARRGHRLHYSAVDQT